MFGLTESLTTLTSASWVDWWCGEGTHFVAAFQQDVMLLNIEYLCSSERHSCRLAPVLQWLNIQYMVEYIYG